MNTEVDILGLATVYLRNNEIYVGKAKQNAKTRYKSDKVNSGTDIFTDIPHTDTAQGVEDVVHDRLLLNKDLTDKVKNILTSMNILLPTKEDWKKLSDDIKENGIYNAYQLSIAPNQSSAYIMEATPSVQPVSNIVEVRDFGFLQAIYPMPYLTNENKHIYKNAYEVDQKKMLDLMAIIQEYVDQAISIVINVKSDTSLKERASIIAYAWKKGIKSLYYWRTQKQSIMADKEPVCESCSV